MLCCNTHDEQLFEIQYWNNKWRAVEREKEMQRQQFSIGILCVLQKSKVKWLCPVVVNVDVPYYSHWDEGIIIISVFVLPKTKSSVLSNMTLAKSFSLWPCHQCLCMCECVRVLRLHNTGPFQYECTTLEKTHALTDWMVFVRRHLRWNSTTKIVNILLLQTMLMLMLVSLLLPTEREREIGRVKCA